MARNQWIVWLAGAALVAAIGCGGGSGGNGDGDGGTGDDGSSGDGSTGDAGGDGSTGMDGGTPGDGGTLVDGSVAEFCADMGGCECSDGEDNDGDGLIDGEDPECTGPYDNDEGSFATGIPGDNRDPMWQDCFFDGNSGSGDDGCRYHTDCLTGDLPDDHRNCTVTDECIEFCAPRTSNGCDCFGCCEVRLEDGSSVFVQIGGECDLESVEDESVCPRCEQSELCVNECGECELCPGKTEEDLPDSCYDTPDGGVDGGTDGGTPYECEDGTTCTETADCGSDEYCQLGCCVPVII